PGPSHVGGPGVGIPGMYEPRRIGQIHEGSATISAMTGEISNNHVAGGGIYYSWLFRSTPQFAMGVHVGGSVSPSDSTLGDYQTEVTGGMVGFEGRFYIPAGLMDIWLSGVVGVGALSLTNYDLNGYETDSITFTGGVVGVGAGINYFITPELSVGGFVRAYRHFFKTEDTLIAPNANGAMEEFTANDYFGIWVVVGASIALHY
ncbi:hypothetical protein KKF84_15680, partial [Myxococcota bacterium]|nr:hypothetical protein [Myxococcota bacterium]